MEAPPENPCSARLVLDHEGWHVRVAIKGVEQQCPGKVTQGEARDAALEVIDGNPRKLIPKLALSREHEPLRPELRRLVERLA